MHAFANTKFNKGNDTILTVSENNNLIVKAFATAWRYKELYEHDIGPDSICKKEHISPRQLYRHSDIAYINPNKKNEILSGTISVKINELFQSAPPKKIMYNCIINQL